MALREQVVSYGVTWLTEWLRSSELRLRPPRGTEGAPLQAVDLGPVEPEAHPEDGCPACRLHREAAEAHSLIDAVARLGRNQHNLELARACYQVAEVELDRLLEAAPRLKLEGERLRVRMRLVAAQLPRPGDRPRGPLKRTERLAEDCRQRAIALTDQYFHPPAELSGERP